MTAIGFVDFVTRVLGVELTPAQRVFARVAFDHVQPRDLGAAEKLLARRIFDLPGKVRGRSVPTLAQSVVVATFGARAGKSWLSALRLLHLAVTLDLSRLAAGEVAAGLICAPDMRLARQCLSYVGGAVKQSPALARMLVGDTGDQVALERPDGRFVRIQCLPATRGGSAVRGRSLVGAVLDESAFFRDDDFIVNDEELFKAISPRVMPGGQTLIVSTPWTRGGLLFELHEANYGHPRTAVAAHAPTLLMRDDAPEVAAVVDRERRRDPVNAAREYDAEFSDASTSLLAGADVDACVAGGVERVPPREDVVYACCVDVGLRNDSTVATVAHVESRYRPNAPPARVLVVDAIAILKPQPGRRVTLDEVEDAVASLAIRYRVPSVHGDIHMADALGPRLQARGLRYVELPMSPSAQETRAKTLAAMFSARCVRLVDNDTLVRELKDLRVQRHPGGRVSVGAPDGKRKHDDAADTLLLLAEVSGRLPECGGDAGRVEFRSDGIVRDEEGVRGVNPRWVRVREDGGEELACVPPWAPGAAEQYEEWAAGGMYTPESLAYFAQRDGGGPGMNVTVQHEGQPAPRRQPDAPWGSGGFTSPGWGFDQKRK